VPWRGSPGMCWCRRAAAVQPNPARPRPRVLGDLSVSFGFVGLALLGLQFALAARSVRVAQPTGVLPLLKFHRGEISYLVLGLILAHPIILVVYDSSFWSLFDVVHAPLRAQLAIASVLALLLLVATSVWRTRMRLSYHAWQVLHATLAVFIVATAFGARTAHRLLRRPAVGTSAVDCLLAGVRLDLAVGAGGQAAATLAQAVASGRGSGAAGGQPHDRPRAGAPWRIRPRRLPVRCGAIRVDHGGALTVCADLSPLLVQLQRPPTHAGGVHHPQFRHLHRRSAPPEGRRARLPGRWGRFRVNPDPRVRVAMIAAGIGVTPMLSMLKTMADGGDRRECVLILGNRSETTIPGRADIEALQATLNLRVVHVLSEPADGWAGESGRVGEQVLAASLPGPHEQWQFFLCGPSAMMDTAESWFAGDGVAAEQFHSERFMMA